jgi:DNA-binding transcriptional MerR regulator
MTIGEFARRSRLPVSTLRYYHELGVLRPAHVDPATGYRYYEPRQLLVAGLVGDLRRAGVAPAAIAEVTSGGLALADVLRAQDRLLQEEIDERQARRAVVRRLLEEPVLPAPAGPVRIERRTRQVVPAETGTIDGRSPVLGVQRLLVALRRRLRQGGATPTGTPTAGEPVTFGAAFPLDLYDEAIRTTVYAIGATTGAAGGPTLTMPAGRYAVVDVPGRHRLAAGYDELLGGAGAAASRAGDRVFEEYRSHGGRPVTRLLIAMEADVTSPTAC